MDVMSNRKPERPGAPLAMSANVRLSMAQFGWLQDVAAREGLGLSATIRHVVQTAMVAELGDPEDNPEAWADAQTAGEIPDHDVLERQDVDDEA
jgi:hypothetical protein